MTLTRLPLGPPIAPMLARLVRELPRGDYLYEPKWDGFRALAFRDGDEVEIQSRNQRPLARYFPELLDAVRAVRSDRFVLDGEIVVLDRGRFDFPGLMLRTHPAASRVALLASRAPATYIAFDLLVADGEDVRESPFAERRDRLERLLADAPSALRATPATEHVAEAERWLRSFTGNGVDGVVAKDRQATYQPGKRAMLKVKVERTADCVVAGFRVFPGRMVASLLLGLYDASGELRHVGVASSFSDERRRSLYEEVRPIVSGLRGHPWQFGFGLERSPVGRLKGSAGRWDPAEMAMDWTPITPIVAEVAFDTMDGRRFRHPAAFRRWRPDRDPASCTFEQLPAEEGNLEALLPSTVGAAS